MLKTILNVVGVVVVIAAVMFTSCVMNDDVDPDNPDNPNNNGDGDNYTYTGRSVTIGGQVWMAENLNRATAHSMCYGTDVSNCAKYGRYYTWDEAMSACPAGWHLPSDAEWTELTDFVGGASTAGRKLKSTSGWYNNSNGTDEYGFSALPCGYFNQYYVFMVTPGDAYHGSWWSSTDGWNGDVALGRSMSDGESVDGIGGTKSFGRTVRCVKD